MDTDEGKFQDRTAAMADMMRQRNNLRGQLEAAKVSIQDLHRVLLAERNLARAERTNMARGV